MTLEESVLRHRLAVIQRAAALGNASQACREFGISRTLFYRWRKRFVRYGQDGLRPRPTRPTRWPRQATPALEHAVVAYVLLWPTHGPARIAAQLRQPRWGRWQVSASGVYGILCRHGLRTRWERLTRLEAHSAVTTGLLTERTRKHVRHPHVEAQRPGDLVCIDAFYIGKLKGVGKVWQLTACDAACSYAIATVVPQVNARTAVHFLRAHVVPTYERTGHRIRAVLTDGGLEFQRASRRRASSWASSTGGPNRVTPGRMALSSGFRGRSSRSCGEWPSGAPITPACRSLSGICKRTCGSTTGSGSIWATASGGALRRCCSGLGWSLKVQTPSPNLTS